MILCGLGSLCVPHVATAPDYWYMLVLCLPFQYFLFEVFRFSFKGLWKVVLVVLLRILVVLVFFSSTWVVICCHPCGSMFSVS